MDGSVVVESRVVEMVVWWMRDGERRAGEVFINWGGAAAWKIKRKARSESAGTSKVILLAIDATSNLQVKVARLYWLAKPRGRNGKWHGC